MWVRKFFLILAMISMACPQCPKTIRIHSPQQVVLPASVLDQFEHMQRAITDVEYMDRLSEEEIWKAFYIVASIIRKSSKSPIEEINSDEEEVHQEIEEYLQERVNRHFLSMQTRLETLACGGVLYSIKKGGKEVGKSLKKAGKWIWKNKWAIFVIILIVALAFFGVKAHNKKQRASAERNSSPAGPNISNAPDKQTKTLLARAHKELQQDLRTHLEGDLKKLDDPTPENQAKSIANTTLSWVTEKWIQCHEVSNGLINQFMHEIVDHTAPVAEFGAFLADQLKREFSTVFVNTIKDLDQGSSFKEDVEDLKGFMHKAIDQLFVSQRALPYQGPDDPLSDLINPKLLHILKPTVGVIPFSPFGLGPGGGAKTIAKAAKCYKKALRKTIKAEKKAAAKALKEGNRTAVYTSVNKGTGEVQYVGITKRLKKRAAEHARTKKIKVNVIRGLENLSRDDARSVEQVLIEMYKLKKEGGTLMNKINSISKTNPKYADSLKNGIKILKERGRL